MESFVFTHATNSIRLLFHSEAAAVRSNLRENFSPQILPINWRSIIQFENIPIGTSSTSDAEFSLEDITPDGIPAVRSMVGDVLLDIPYYLSHHKTKIQETVIKETNRIYRLWCENNPGFECKGRVHILGHSLGSAIAMDILSNQPTTLQPNLTGPIRTDIFEFDTKSFFAVGSPCGFFMLLHRTNLIPRAGRRKTKDAEAGIAHDGVGRYGCPAVDNIYNIYHSCDPVAQKLSPTVDSRYASLLAPTIIPPLSASLFSTFSFRSLFPGSETSPPQTTRQPSIIELSLHDFSRESIAENRFGMLNDYSQLDFVLEPQGVVENQYLSMIGAHGSYWSSREFARFLIIEIGRPEGREFCVESLRGVRKEESKKVA
ncbi:putative phospholipase [Neolecta irregularis DAH-3]|uniref:Putative phospholipase n=1 Tax=Neolecta irregularis (strain DAH-3) TaxID=1198029 RepID=A0A1U7LPD5_NEOID|nr:putative phospholipase [Neolecta irregularis DAH-3]|eukprot:OLL24515.1 putative phospholipase [Neolecta irregularis DAH-3]